MWIAVIRKAYLNAILWQGVSKQIVGAAIQVCAGDDVIPRARQILHGRPWLFLLVDVTRLTKISSEGRQLAAQGSRDLNLRGVAMVGASASIRVLAGLVSRAVELVSGSGDNPTRFFETEREARAWINARRREVRESAKLR